MKTPRSFFKPLAIARAPRRSLSFRSLAADRMIHFIPPHVLEDARQKSPELMREVDVVLGHLADRIPAVRQGGRALARLHRGWAQAGLWHQKRLCGPRINELNFAVGARRHHAGSWRRPANKLDVG